jgi:hypothetical protein
LTELKEKGSVSVIRAKLVKQVPAGLKNWNQIQNNSIVNPNITESNLTYPNLTLPILT